MKSLALATLLAAAAAITPSIGAAQDKKEEAKSPHTLTGNLGFVSEYRYRGITQTHSKPAVQGGFDYAHASGAYLGAWGSNVNWLSDLGASNSLELDLYGGYKGAAGDVSYDVGGLYYWYPGTYAAGFTKPHTFEIYAAGTWKWLTLKYSHSLTNIFGFADSKNAGYLDLTGTLPMADGLNLVAHVGHQIIPSSSANGRAKSDCSYTDWRLGMTYDYAGFTFGAAYVDTNAKGGAGQCYRNPYNKDLGRSTLVLSVLKSF